MKYRIDIEAGLKQSVADESRIQSIVHKAVSFNGRHKSRQFIKIAPFLVGGISIILIILLPYFYGLKENSQISLELSLEGQYLGFNNQPAIGSMDNAIAKGYIVENDSKLIANQKNWDDFVRQSKKGKNASIRIAHFYSGEHSEPVFTDVYFVDGFYYRFDSSSEQQDAKPFTYLLELQNEFGKPSRITTISVLTNDQNLTFNDVIQFWVSSNSEVRKKISVFDFIFLNQH